MRRFVVALAVMAVTSGSLFAAEIRGTLKKIEPSRNRIIMTVNDQDRTVEMSRKTTVYTLVSVGRPRRATVQLQQTPDGINALQPGMFVTVRTEDRDGIEMATEVREDSGPTTASSGGRRRLLRR